MHAAQMYWIDSLFWWIGALVCALGVFIGICLIALWPVEWMWRKYGSMRVLADVLFEARRQGRSIYGADKEDEK